MGLMMWLRTGLLMAILTGLLMGMGYLFGGPSWAFMMFLFSLVFNFFTYWYSDRIVLSWYNARVVDEYEAPELYTIVRNLAERAGLPTPRIAIIPTETPNAFATGRDPNHAVVAVTQGLLRLLNRDELEGVLGHELTHIKHRDILIGTVAAAMAGAIMQLAYWARWIAIFGGFGDDRDGDNALVAIMIAILAPIAAMLIQAAISRSREFLADEGGAKISGKPHALASALMKIEQAVNYRPMREGNPATAHMFIVNPFRGGLAGLFSTHPPTEARIERLRRIAEEMGIYF